jgi:hypothetical protein
MKKILLFAITANLFVNTTMSQPKNEEKGQQGQSNEVSLNFDLPVSGYLKDISSFGIGAQYAWSNHHFGKMSSIPESPFGFTFNAGTDYYFGKKQSSGIYSIKYDGTTYLHAYGGGIFNPCDRGNISLTAGPSLELYNGDSQFGFGVNLSGSLYFNKCGRFALSPDFTFMKQGSSDPIYVAGLRCDLSFK